MKNRQGSALHFSVFVVQYSRLYLFCDFLSEDIKKIWQKIEKRCNWGNGEVSWQAISWIMLTKH